MKRSLRPAGPFCLALFFVCAGLPMSADAQKRPIRATPSPAGDQDPPPPVEPDVVSRGDNGRVVVRAIRLTEPLTIQLTE